MISLLFPNDNRNVGNISQLTISDLSLDRSFIPILPDDTTRREFLKLLASPARDIDTVLYRQEIMRDFLHNTGILQELQSLLDRYEHIFSDFEKQRKLLLSKRNVRVEKLDYTDIQTLLSMSATTLKRVLRFTAELLRVFENRDIHSRGLLNFKNRLIFISTAPEYTNLIELCGIIESTGGGDIRELRLKLNEKGRILSEIQSIIPENIATAKKFFSPKSKKKAEKNAPPPEEEGVELFGVIPWLREALYSEAAGSAASALGQIALLVVNEFSSIRHDLIIYIGGLRMSELLRASGATLTFPTISEKPILVCRDLRDLYLLTLANRADAVIPNDVNISAVSGILIFGANNSGKTVYLRSVGTAQLLAQAGLPLPAISAEIGIRSSVCTCFAAAEEEAGTGAGRFEQEVSHLAPLIENACPDTLLLFNEIFQTTAYDEGAQGLYYILKHLNTIGCTWICVSHLKNLQNKLGESATVLHTTNEYKIEKQEQNYELGRNLV